MYTLYCGIQPKAPFLHDKSALLKFLFHTGAPSLLGVHCLNARFVFLYFNDKPAALQFLQHCQVGFADKHLILCAASQPWKEKFPAEHFVRPQVSTSVAEVSSASAHEASEAEVSSASDHKAVLPPVMVWFQASLQAAQALVSSPEVADQEAASVLLATMNEDLRLFQAGVLTSPPATSPMCVTPPAHSPDPALPLFAPHVLGTPTAQIAPSALLGLQPCVQMDEYPEVSPDEASSPAQLSAELPCPLERPCPMMSDCGSMCSVLVAAPPPVQKLTMDQGTQVHVAVQDQCCQTGLVGPAHHDQSCQTSMVVQDFSDQCCQTSLVVLDPIGQDHRCQACQTYLVVQDHSSLCF